MGSSESKIKIKDEKEIPASPSNVPSTPIQCAELNNFKNYSDLDPRSPSDNITRTPLEIPAKTTPQANNETISNLMYAIDPRSPSDQFTRTPVIIHDNVSSELPSKLHNKLLDNARRSIMYAPTISNHQIQKEYNQISSFVTPPKLLESSPISRRNNSKRKSFVGLLETNIDYTETDLDKYMTRKSLSSNLSINVNENDSLLGSIIKCENCDPRSPSTDFLRTPIQIIKKIGEIDLNDAMSDNLVLDDKIHKIVCNNSESLLKIVDINEQEQDNIDDEVEFVESLKDEQIYTQEVLSETETVASNEKSHNTNIEANENTSSANVEIHSVSHEKLVDIVKDLIDHVEALTTENTKLKKTLDLDAAEVKEPVIDLTADVQEFDRKLTKIIYEDDDTFSFRGTPKGNQDEQTNKRTPMKDRNLIDIPKRNKLKVSDKPRKSEYAVSKIPLFREKNGGKLKIQCENTPPSSMDRRLKKSSKPKWDSDKTLVI